MKQEEIEDLEKIKMEGELPKEKKQTLIKMAFDNIFNLNSIMLLLIVLIAIPEFVSKEFALVVYKTICMALLFFSIFLFERAFKKKEIITTTYGMEMLVLAIIILYAPYSFVKFNNMFLKLSGVYYAVYYIIKTVIMYYKAKKEHRETVSDIAEIVKKESKDNIRKKKQKEEQIKQEEIQNEVNFIIEPEVLEEKTSNKRTTNKKATNKTTTNIKKKEAEKETKGNVRKETNNNVEAKPKAKRGRPPKKDANLKQDTNKDKTVKKKEPTKKNTSTEKPKTVTKKAESSTKTKATTAKSQKKEQIKQETKLKKDETVVETPRKRGRPRKEPIAK